MAILKFKKLIEDLENNTTQVLSSVTKVASTASYAGTSLKATSAGNAGTSLIAHYGSSGTGALAGTHALYQSGALGF